MKDDDSDDFFAEEIDEHEYEISATSKRPINWRRIELFKENKWLKEQLSDFNDWVDE